MASTPCTLEKSTLPAGSPVSVSWELTPGQLALTVSATWDAAAPEFLGRKDFLLCIDRQLVYRGRAWDQLPGVWGPAPDTWVGHTQTFTARLKTDYFGWSPGYHQLTYGHLFNYNPNEYTRYEASFGLTLPAAPLGPQSPAPAFVPGKVLRNLFFLGPQNPPVEPGLTAQAMRDAGVNCLTIGGFSRPGHATYAAWKADWDNTARADWTLGQIDWAIANGFYVVVEMDGLYRGTAERQWWDTCPWRDDAVRHVRDTFAARRPWVAVISGNDECVWGKDAQNHDYPPIDTRALHTLWRENPQAPPWCWPNYDPAAYETLDQADASIRYVRQTTPDATPPLSPSGRGASLPERARAYQILGQMAAGVPAGWPVGISTFGCSTYQKLTDGAYYAGYPNPTTIDWQLNEGVLPEHAAANFWLPLILARPMPTLLRCYFYDAPQQKQKRATSAKAAVGLLQQGVVYGSPLWSAMGRAFKSIEAREALLTSRTPLPPAYLDNWATGGVTGLEVAVNCAPFARLWRGTTVPAGGVWLSDGEVVA